MNKAYLNLGSNIEAEKNIPQVVKLLKEVGSVKAISSIWETKSVGYDGPNFLNMCILFLTELGSNELKERVIRPIESQLGRIRDENKNVPRTIDIDLVLFDETLHNIEMWKHAFVIMPLAELIPNFVHPFEDKSLVEVAEQIQVWVLKREDVVIS